MCISGRIMRWVVLFSLLLSSIILSLQVWASPIKSKQQAIKIAAQYIGLRLPLKTPVSVTQVVPKDDQTPFLNKQINGRKCYQIQFSKLQIPMPWGNEKEEVISSIHELNVLVDAKTKKLFRVWSTKRFNTPSTRRTAEEIVNDISPTTSEKWIGFPNKRPKLPLLRLLYNRESRFATEMEQLDVYYITLSKEGLNRKHDTWQIILRSTKPFSPRQRPEQRNPEVYGWRVAIDGQTGQSFEDSNIY